MALVLKGIYNFCHHLESPDSQIDHYFLMGSPMKILTLLGAYFYFVKYAGPKYMDERKPFQINNILVIYNITQVILNSALFIYGIFTLITMDYDLRCATIDYSFSAKNLFETRLMYFFYMLKILDLLDTVFFVLRKKDNQITFLHVYHHSLITLFSYIYTRYIPGGHAMVLGLVNSFVHAIMYFYYFLTAFKPELKSSIWWKKHITHVQMLQFILLVIHFGHPLFFNTCDYPKYALFIPFSQAFVMLYLFSNFYVKTYIKKPINKKH